jgi:TM2 domain-containing membrane protein YozV
MSVNSNCPYCGTTFDGSTKFCQKCGLRANQESNLLNKTLSTKSGKTALILITLFGALGIHRFYVGKIGTGLLMLLTSGLLGLWTLIDLILIVQNKFKDAQGRYVVLSFDFSPRKKIALTLGAIITWFIITFSVVILFSIYKHQMMQVG